MYITIMILTIGSVPVFSTTEFGVTGSDSTTEYETTLNTTTESVATEIAQIPIIPEDIPYQVSLHYSYNDNFICGGSIVSSKMVLTSAHCMYYRWGGLMPPIIVTVSAGRRNLNETSSIIFNVANITLHPLFNKTSLGNDLAVIEIEGSFEVDNLMDQIDLEKNIPELGYNSCIVSGWNQITYEFQVMEVILVDCANYPGHICTNKKYQNDPACINNAGNPLVCDNKLIGVLSVEADCEDASQLAIFENLRHSKSWLNVAVSSARGFNFEHIIKLLLFHILLKLIYFILDNI